MARITREELLKLTQMASIEIIEDEIPAVLEKMNAVLEYARRVQQLVQNSGSQIPATKSVNVFREDIALVCEPEEILALAPEKENSYFVVPKIISSLEVL